MEKSIFGMLMRQPLAEGLLDSVRMVAGLQKDPAMIRRLGVLTQPSDLWGDVGG